MKTKNGKRQRAGKKYRKAGLAVRAWESQECKPCRKWLKNPTALEQHLASRLHRKKAGGATRKVWKDMLQMWVESMVARMEKAEGEEREKLKVIARTNPEECRKEIWAMANEKPPNCIQRRSACGEVARRILHITNNVKCDCAVEEVRREGWDFHGHTTSRPWEPLRQFKGKKNQVDGVERFIANALLY